MKLYKEYYLSKKAERFVNKIWVLDNSQNNKAVENKMVLPNGCYNLAFVSGNGWEVIIKNESYKMVTGTYLNAQITQKAIINIQPKTKVILIQLHAWALSQFSSFDLSNFRDKIIPINSEILPFLNKIKSSFFGDEKEIIALSNKIFEDLSDNNPEKKLCELMCENIALENQRILTNIEGVAYSNRALQIEFKKSTGLTRKQYSKLINLRTTVDYISHPEYESDNLTSIAYRSGYFDQTHFIKTFKQIVKTTPRKFEAQSFFLSQIR